MATKLVSAVVDALDPPRLAQFWSDALGYRITVPEPGEVAVEPPVGGPGLGILFEPVSEPKVQQNRIHLDLASTSPDDQEAIVARLESIGAKRIDIGQKDVPWVVLADPEGNELCVLEPRDEYLDRGSIAAVVVEALDPPALADFWAAATGWTVNLSPDDFARLVPPAPDQPFLEFIKVTRLKQGKNRFHLDIAPPAEGDQAAEVARLEALGARPADVGQGDVSWVVLADPEGNEFCVLTPR